MGRGRPKKIKAESEQIEEVNLFSGACVLCGSKVKADRANIHVDINMFNEEYSFLNCPDCNGNMTIRLAHRLEK